MSLIEKPLVSVLMCSYNSEEFISEAIESVIRSNYENWELIIVDDNSKDQTLCIAKRYSREDTRITVYNNEINLGDYPNRNKAVEYANGKYLKYLDHDDILYKYSLDYMVEAMEKCPSAGFGLGFVAPDDIRPYPLFYNTKETFRELYLRIGFLGYGPSSSIIRKECFVECGGFSKVLFMGDQELWLKLAYNYDVVKLQPSLIWYRRHEKQESNREIDDWESRDRRYKLTLDYLQKSKSFFTEEEFQYASKKIKQHYARGLLRFLINKQSIFTFFKAWRTSNLTILELLSGFKHYIK